MKEYYCEGCESFSWDLTCKRCGLEFIEPDWSIKRAIEQREQLSEQINMKLL